MLAAIAWRNLWRNKLRSSVIFASITIGIIGAVITDGFMAGMTDQRADAAIANEVSNIQIHNPEYLLNQEIKYTIPDAEGMVTKIRGLSEVKGVSLRLKINAMAASANAGAGINLYGVQPDAERKVSNLHNLLVSGVYLKNDQRFPAVIGQKLAKKLNIGVGDKLIVTLTDTTGTITSGAYNVVGIYKTANDIFDESHVFVKRSDLSKLVGFPDTTGDEIAILLTNNEQTQQVVDKLNKLFAPMVKQKAILIQSWEQIQPLIKSMIDMMDYFSYLFLLIILAALAFAIINTMLMSVMERTREFGMLMALGMNRRKIFTMILTETIFLSIIGALLGLGISILIVNYYATHGFDLSSVARGMNYLGYSAQIFFRVNSQFYIMSMVLVVIIAMLSGISPAMKALKLQPATAIRENN
ncbi:MAG: ABC transporter permease [Bacteroidales bacterium]|nr:ABC transporter permease [Bacteroidales bacterium]